MRCCPFSLSDSQWSLLAPLLPAKYIGRHSLRTIVNALFYLTKTGCQWRCLPPHYPPWPVVYYHFRRLNSLGAWPHIVSKLRVLTRLQAGKTAEPTAAVVDSQSVRTEAGVHRAKGWDGAKKLWGRKRHLVTDTLGLPLALRVGSGAATDRAGLASMSYGLDRAFTLKVLYADNGYRGMHLTEAPLRIPERADRSSRWHKAEERKAIRHFEPVAKRWVIERSFGWLSRYRRLTRDYEKLPACSAAMIWIAFTQLLTKRLAKQL